MKWQKKVFFLVFLPVEEMREETGGDGRRREETGGGGEGGGRGVLRGRLRVASYPAEGAS